MIVGICGIIGSGKSRLSKLMQFEGEWDYIHCDELFKIYSNNSKYHRYLSKFLDKNKCLDVILSLDLVFSDSEKSAGYPLIRALNIFNEPFITHMILDAVDPKKNTIIELATLPNMVISNICDIIIRTIDLRNNDKTIEGISKYKNIQINTLKNIQSFQSNAIKDVNYIINVMDHSDEELVNEFNELINKEK